MARIRLLEFFAALIVVGCSSDQEDVCDNLGACEQGGSSDWIQSCKHEAELVHDDTEAAGCGGLFDDYYACASSSFECRGATAAFPGCDEKRAALDGCLAKAQAQTSCAKLEAATAQCAGPDAGGGTSPPACTSARDCTARCFLENVKNACAPAPDELTTVTTCASSCPP